jgi:hypothetical protein
MDIAQANPSRSGHEHTVRAVIQKTREAVIGHSSAITISLMIAIGGGLFYAGYWASRVDLRLAAMEDCAQRLTALEAIVGTRVTHPPPAGR